MYTGVVHLVSSNPLHANTVKKTTPPFFSTNLSLKKKPTLTFHPSISLSCNASSHKNDEITPELNVDQTEILPSKNGRSNSNNSKSVNQELRKILAKYFPLMQEAAEKNTLKNSRNYGNYFSKAAREKTDDSKMDAFANLLELVKNTGMEKQKNVSSKKSSANLDSESYIKNFFEYDDSIESEDESDPELVESESESVPIESESVLIESDSVPIESDSVPIESDSVPVKSRPKSSFSKRSPIPEVRYEPIVALNVQQKGKDESKSGIYEPVSLDPSDDENESLDLEIPDLEIPDLENQDLGSGKLEESLDLESLKVVELREIAKARGMKGYSKMKKAELVEQLSLLS